MRVRIHSKAESAIVQRSRDYGLMEDYIDECDLWAFWGRKDGKIKDNYRVERLCDILFTLPRC